MKGKIGLVVGLGVGYVLGTRAGRERYEQIKTQWLKVWHLDPVQEQVTKVTDFAKSQAAAVPTALWNGAVKVIRSVGGEDAVTEAPAPAPKTTAKTPTKTPAKAPAKTPAKKPTQSEK